MHELKNDTDLYNYPCIRVATFVGHLWSLRLRSGHAFEFLSDSLKNTVTYVAFTRGSCDYW